MLLLLLLLLLLIAGITVDGENIRLMVINCVRPLLGN